MTGKICIVTGSNTGIGKETARGLLRLGATVILACRDAQKAELTRAELAAEAGHGSVSVMPLDLADISSIRAFAKQFRAEHKHLNLLVNNAGVWTTTRSTTVDGFETTFGVNHVGTFLLTHELLPLLLASTPSRIVVLSSSLHYRAAMNWDDLQCSARTFKGPAAYNQSKLANVLFTNALARRLKGKGVTVNAVHPGVVATELARAYPKLLVKLFHLFLLSPEQGAACTIHVSTAPELEGVSGLYFEKSKAKAASKAALDEAAQEKLWAATEQLLEKL
jgi:NAD(P)-dependent dehydrogenase (short-subunit alcohol dehydrogenase family)